MGIFFGFGNTQLSFVVFRHPLAEGVNQGSGWVSNRSFDVSGVFGQHHEIDVNHFLTREAVEICVYECTSDFARAVSTEVHENQRIAVFHCRIWLTEKLVAAIKSGKYDTIICNYPNGDMVGHTGVMEAAVKAVEALDHCVEEVAKAVESVGGQLLITADHGNAEQMRDPATGQAHTAHTNLPVPLIYVGDKNVKAVAGGKLSDIAPTMLSLMGMEIPQEMTGKPLFIVE